jgi:hypothetical protein
MTKLSAMEQTEEEFITLKSHLTSLMTCSSKINEKSKIEIRKDYEKFNICVRRYIAPNMEANKFRLHTYWILNHKKHRIKIFKCSNEKMKSFSIIDDFSGEAVCFKLFYKKNESAAGHVFFENQKVTRILSKPI